MKINNNSIVDIKGNEYTAKYVKVDDATVKMTVKIGDKDMVVLYKNGDDHFDEVVKFAVPATEAEQVKPVQPIEKKTAEKKTEEKDKAERKELVDLTERIVNQKNQITKMEKQINDLSLQINEQQKKTAEREKRVSEQAQIIGVLEQKIKQQEEVIAALKSKLSNQTAPKSFATVIEDKDISRVRVVLTEDAPESAVKLLEDNKFFYSHNTKSWHRRLYASYIKLANQLADQINGVTEESVAAD